MKINPMNFPLILEALLFYKKYVLIILFNEALP